MYKKDKDITKSIPGYRRILAHITPSRQAASIYFTQTINVSKTLPWLEKINQTQEKKITFMHIAICAMVRALNERPQLNRYVTGYRFFQRDGVTVSVSVKKTLTDGAKIVLLKIPTDKNDTPQTIRDKLQPDLSASRSGKDLHQEKEVGLFLKLPSFLLQWALKLLNFLDRRHWLPGFFVDPDPLYTSLVVANLGSVGLDSAYHHLYEYGNCPFFGLIGKINTKLILENEKPTEVPFVDIKYSFDERVEDGLACALSLEMAKKWMENPELLYNSI